MSLSIRSTDEPTFVFCAPHGKHASEVGIDHVEELALSIRNLCKHLAPISKAQLIPENVLLAECVAKSENRLSFLEILPTDLCNHTCTWCFTASSRSTNIIHGGALRDRLEKFLDGGGKSILISGGGEPLLFKPLSEPSPMFGESTVVQWITKRDAAAALITNGVFLDKFLSANEDCFQKLAFLRISLDAYSASRYESLHAARPGDFERVLCALRRAVQLRSSSLRPAIGVSFVVDSFDGLNCSPKDFEAIDCLAAAAGIDFVQVKHVHTIEQVAADSAMLRIGELLAKLPRQQHEWWVHRYLSSPADTECAVPLVAQVLRSDGKRSPCCHLQHFDVQEPAGSRGLSPFRVAGCHSAVCRYVSMNGLLKVLEEGGTAYLDALRRLKVSLEQDGFHPYRLFPSSPDLISSSSHAR